MKKLNSLSRILFFFLIAAFALTACSGGSGNSTNGGDSSNIVAVTGVSLNKSSSAISAGNTEQLTATITPSNATNQNVIWTSSNGSAVTVSTGGLMSRTVLGNAVITVTTEDGNFTASCTVTVPIQRLSIDSSGAQGDNNSDSPSISADGRYVAFSSRATNLVPGDTNSTCDVFVHDRQTQTIERVSVDSNGVQDSGSFGSFGPSISADGRFVAFYSTATNLVSDDTNGSPDIFVHDRQTKTTERVSVDSNGVQGDSESYVPSISADGRFVSFESTATNLVSGDTNGYSDIFVHDRQTKTTERVSVDSNGVQGDSDSNMASISADGRYVAFSSGASNLVTGDTNGTTDVFVYDRQTDAIRRVSVDSSGAEGDSESVAPSISAGGRFVSFESAATNLVSGDTNGFFDIFVYDLQTNAIQRLSVDSNGAQGNSQSNMASISADGRYVAFSSYATNLVFGDTNGYPDIFVHDRQTSTIKRVSLDPNGAEGNMGGSDPCISADGLYVAFYSEATNLVTGDTNGFADIFAAPVP